MTERSFSTGKKRRPYTSANKARSKDLPNFTVPAKPPRTAGPHPNPLVSCYKKNQASRQWIKFQISQRLHLVFTHPLVRGIRANRFIREQARPHYSPSHPPAFHRQNKFANLFFYPLLPEALTCHTFYYPALNMSIYVPQKKRCFIYETSHKTQ